MQFLNTDYRKSEPDYFYLVREFVTTFGMDEGKHHSFSHKQKFEGKNLLQCRADAIKYYNERLQGLEREGKYFLPFAAPENFTMGSNAAFSITLSFVEYYSDEECDEHVLIGEDDQTTAESREIELAVLKEKGLL